MTHYIPKYSRKATTGYFHQICPHWYTFTTPWFIGDNHGYKTNVDPTINDLIFLEFLSTIPIYVVFIFSVQYVGHLIYSTFSVDVYYSEVGSA